MFPGVKCDSRYVPTNYSLIWRIWIAAHPALLLPKGFYLAENNIEIFKFGILSFNHKKFSIEKLLEAEWKAGSICTGWKAEHEHKT